MDILGYLFISMDIDGYVWIFMDIHLFLWISMDNHGFLCISMDIHGYPWIYTRISMDIHGYPWMSMDIHGHPYPYDRFFKQKNQKTSFVERRWNSIKLSKPTKSVYLNALCIMKPSVGWGESVWCQGLAGLGEKLLPSCMQTHAPSGVYMFPIMQSLIPTAQWERKTCQLVIL